MPCTHCGSAAPPQDGRCPDCGTLVSPKGSSAFPEGDVTMAPGDPGTSGGGAAADNPGMFATADGTRVLDGDVTMLPFDAPTVLGPDPPASDGTRRPGTLPPLSVGHDFGTRYHIIRTLGTGGMGAVYQAWDKVLEVAVAIKVIRPDKTLSPEAARALEKRFKRELLLARQVTHRNVVRIHDLGEVDGITYITMPYVQGSDLATVMRREGRLPVERVLHIARQVASGLAAAHDAGVVHRDLKPANIMLDADDDALIMDFGIARSTSATALGMTVAGAIVGTIEYMAPEQAQGTPVDRRADIYSFGLILYDMLVGRPQTGASTAVSELMRRILTPPPPVRTVDPSIPEWLEAIITRCLQPDPAARFASMQEVLDAIGQAETSLAGSRVGMSAVAQIPLARPWWHRLRERRAIAAAAVVVLLAAGGYATWTSLRPVEAPPAPVATGPSVSLVVLPFRNASSDPTLDTVGASVSQVLSTMLGQSSTVRTVSPDRLTQVLKDLRIGANASLTPVELARVADFTSTQHVIWGQITRFANAIRIDATLQDLERNETVPLSAAAPNEEGLLNAISELAASVQTELARGSSDVLTELRATAWKPSTGSFEALRRYNEGVQLLQQGTYQAALKSFQAAVQDDGNFALALSALAQTYAALGYDNEAGQYSRQAMALRDGLPAQEKHRIAANHYRIVNDVDRAIESYENILKASPGDEMIQYTLGGLYEQRGALDKAHEQFAAVVQSDPKFVQALLALGRVEIRLGNPQDSLQYLERARTLAIELGNREARANVLQAIGIAYMRLSRPDEALRQYEESLAIKREVGDKRGMAASLVQIGEVKRTLGEPKVAEESYREALALRREIGDKAGLSVTLMDLAALYTDQLGRPRDALTLLQEALTILRETGNTNLEARALNNIGSAYASQGNYVDAQTYFERSLELREKAQSPGETADTLHNLATTFTSMGRYEQALQRYVRALELRRSSGDRRSAALEQHGIGTLLDYQGRFGAAAEAKKDAVQILRDLGSRDAVLSEALGGYGESLALSGQIGEAQAPLDEALSIARELDNRSLIAQTLRLQAERQYLAGDLDAAAALAAQAEQAAKEAADRTVTLQAEATAAIVASARQPSQALTSRLAALAKEADARGLRALAAECTANRARALLTLGNADAARQDADRAVAVSDSLGLRVTMAVAQFVRASSLAAKKDAAARREYASALRLLEQVRSDAGNQKLLERADLRAIHAESLAGSGAS